MNAKIIKQRKHFLTDEQIEECLIDKNDFIAKSSLDDLFGHLFYYVRDVVYIDNSVYTKIVEKDLNNLLSAEKYRNIFWELIEVKKKSGESEFKLKWKVNVSKIYTYAKFNKLDDIYFKGVEYKKDERIVLDYDRRELTVYVCNLYFKNNCDVVIDEKVKKEIIADYYNHFPLLDDFIDFVVACRFTENRKRSFLYLNAPSDWGKSFLMSIFADEKLALEIEYKDIVDNNKPVPLKAMQVLKSLMLFLDEFTVFKKEMKKITHKIYVEEKFQPKVAVELYAKILMSAEKSVSFTDTVETQLINRVLMMEIKSDIQLTDRAVYKKYGNRLYKRVLKNHILDMLKNKINKYLELDEFERDRVAENKLNELYEKYKIENIDLETYLIGFFAEQLSYLVDLAGAIPEDLNFADKTLLSYLHFKEGDETIYISNFAKFVDDLFKTKLDVTKIKSAEYKKSQLIQILFDKKNIREALKLVRFKKGENPKRVIPVNLKDLRYKYLIKTKIFEFEDYKIKFKNLEDLAIKINELVKDLYQMPNFREKLRDLKDVIELYGLTRDFVISIDEKGNLFGVEFKKIKPEKEFNGDIPF